MERAKSSSRLTRDKQIETSIAARCVAAKRNEMKHTQYSEEALRRYLMGELPATEQVALETEYFGDRELYEQICELENDLIDDYVQGRMAPADREQFERHYLTIPEKHQQVEFARAMRRSLPRTASTSSAEPSKLVEAPSESRSWWSS